MTVKYSRALLNEIAGGKSVRAALEDMVLDIYGGACPTNPEDVRTGTKLARYTLDGEAVATTERGTPRSYTLVPAAGFATGSTIKVTVTVDGVETTHTYTILAADTDSQKVADKVARMLNDIPQIQAICLGDSVTIWAQCRIAGLALTLADGTGTYAIAVTPKVAAVRGHTLQFSKPTAGVISKPAGVVWQCSSNLATGVAGYFTLCTPDDCAVGVNGPVDTDYVKKRAQGTLATVGGDATIDPATVTILAVSTITTFSLTLPTSKT